MSCKEARLRRGPRAHVPHWATKTVCFSSSVTAIIAKAFQPCHRGRRLLHLFRRSSHTGQSDGNDVHSNGQDVPRIGDPDSDLIELVVSLFSKRRRTVCLVILACVVLSSDLRAIEIQSVRGFSCTGVAFYFFSRLLKTFKNAERPLNCCCSWAANRLYCMPGVGPGGSSAPVALAWVSRLWRVAFVCGPQLVGFQRTRDEPSDFENCLLAVTCS